MHNLEYSILSAKNCCSGKRNFSVDRDGSAFRQYRATKIYYRFSVSNAFYGRDWHYISINV